MWNHKTILGYTDKETLKLDFDDTTFKIVRYWAYRTNNWYKLDGFMILISSENNYHVVFNRAVTWEENMSIVAWVCLESENEELKKWLIMQCIKKASTLRLSPKGDKKSPMILYEEGNQDKRIKNYLSLRQQIKDIIKEISKMMS